MMMRALRRFLAALTTALATGLLALVLQAAPAAAQSSCDVENFAAAPCPTPSPSPSPTATPTPTPTPTPIPSISPTPTPTGAGNSAAAINGLADQRFNQMITNRVLGLVLLGVNEQINCNDCISAFGSAGSFSAGIHGRKQLTSNLALLAGLAYTHYNENGYHVTSAPIGAFALRYDVTDWGSSRPFFDIGTILTPYERVRYGRSYVTSLGSVTVDGTTTASNYAVHGRAGWISRMSPRDEIAASIELWQLWQRVGAYRDPAVAFNPFDASIAGGTDRTSLLKVGGQWTHLFGSSIEANVNGGYVQSFASKSGLVATVTGNGTVTPTTGNQGWFEYGGRLGFRLQKGWIADLFVNGTLGPQPVGNTIHGGVGLRIHY
ncbi:conserved exported hypothetical protein [Bradyrhizobium sp. ORS 375]|uniref:hypothetical protein n=1 Tax=Bradyrhizobium sp. (strain ORS 375) TaxID=566679 RepID=UPI0002405DF4|nr:hypothetical protein [Bradyrhizobium sp. ORS 375]CCD94225.1 conserved exported hypothetical protein [Bradyrhizobium sp. ORS 375]